VGMRMNQALAVEGVEKGRAGKARTRAQDPSRNTRRGPGRAHLDEDEEGETASPAPAQKPLADKKVSGGGNGDELGQPLDDSEQQALDDGHGGSPGDDRRTIPKIGRPRKGGAVTFRSKKLQIGLPSEVLMKKTILSLFRSAGRGGPGLSQNVVFKLNGGFSWLNGSDLNAGLRARRKPSKPPPRRRPGVSKRSTTVGRPA